METLKKLSSVFFKMRDAVKKVEDVQHDAEEILKEAKETQDKILNKVTASLTDEEWLNIINTSFTDVMKHYDNDRSVIIIRHAYDEVYNKIINAHEKTILQKRIVVLEQQRNNG